MERALAIIGIVAIQAGLVVGIGIGLREVGFGDVPMDIRLLVFLFWLGIPAIVGRILAWLAFERR